MPSPPTPEQWSWLVQFQREEIAAVAAVNLEMAVPKEIADKARRLLALAAENLTTAGYPNYALAPTQ